MMWQTALILTFPRLKVFENFLFQFKRLRKLPQRNHIRIRKPGLRQLSRFQTRLYSVRKPRLHQPHRFQTRLYPVQMISNAGKSTLEHFMVLKNGKIGAEEAIAEVLLLVIVLLRDKQASPSYLEILAPI